MNILNNFQFNQNEAQNLRLHQVPNLSLPAWRGGIVFETAGNTANISLDGSTWKKILTAGAILPADISLTTGSFIIGAANVGSATVIATYPFSNFGDANSDVGMGGNKITNLGTCTVDTDAANKAYVDSVAQGLDTKPSVRCATTVNLAGTYNNGAGTLTSSGNNALPLIDGVSAGTNARILVKNQTTAYQNGVYTVTSLGSAGYSPWVLTRALDMNVAAEFVSAFVFVEQGDAAADTGWVQTADNITLGTTAIAWSQFSSSASLSEGNGIVIVGNQIHFQGSANYTSGDLFYANGLTTIGKIGIGAQGKILGASSANIPAWSNATYPGITANFANANGVLYSSSTTAAAITGTANSAVLITSGAGVPSFSTDLPTGITIGGSYIPRTGGTDIAMADGGTGASLVGNIGALVYTASSTQMAIMPAGFATGNFVRMNTAGAPSAFDLFGTANNWTMFQSFNPSSTPADAIVIDISSLGVAGVKSSNLLRFTARAFDTIPHNVDWIMFVTPDLNSGASSSLRFQTRRDTESYTDSLTVNTTSTSKWGMGAGLLGYYNGANWIELAFTTGAGQHSLVLPSASGTVALTNSTMTGVWNGTVIAMQYGGTSANLTPSNGGIIYSGATTMGVLAGTTGIKLLLSNGAASPQWSGYTFPATLTGSNLLFIGSAASVSSLASANNSVLTTNGSGVIGWTAFSPGTGTIGIARRYSVVLTGSAALTYDVVHNLATKDVTWSMRYATTAGDTGGGEFLYTKVEVIDANTLRFYMSVTSAGLFYRVTVTG